ncbi:hypothetical protein SAMN05421783_11133 [Thiocapsa roseopersicina]|uniref:Uncharacterized protein n=1 Tax=Thiocapsa roseopersicina TaxID=1058 RepID=A0A1H2XNE8_THIRO|nr:hypothetical protein SAMN05421783_11133 [Thiocapsa roseopersicina]
MSDVSPDPEMGSHRISLPLLAISARRGSAEGRRTVRGRAVRDTGRVTLNQAYEDRT